MSLRRGVGTLAIAFTLTGAGAGPAAAYFYGTNFEPYTAASLAHHHNAEASATVIRRHKHGPAGSQRQVADGPGRRDGLPTGRS
jgi:hypothetical protein